MTRSRALFTAVLVGGLVFAVGGRLSRGQGSNAPFIRGDANVDGDRNIADAVYLLGCSFLGTECPACSDSGDLDDDGMFNITDPVYLLNFLFAGGPGPRPPSDGCGQDPTSDELTCAAFPPCSTGGGDTVPTARGDVLITPIEHATLALRWDGKTIYVDPVGGAAPFRSLPPPDIILVTDIHSDHMEGATIRAVAVEGTSLVLPGAVSRALAGAGGVGKATEVLLSNGETKEVQGIPVLAVPMYNLTPDRLRYHEKGRGNGYVLDLAGTKVYISGDTEDIPEMRALRGISAAFLCMNLPFTMTPAQAASAVLEFQPAVVYPYHHRGQRPEDFQALVAAGSKTIEVRIRNWYP